MAPGLALKAGFLYMVSWACCAPVSRKLQRIPRPREGAFSVCRYQQGSRRSIRAQSRTKSIYPRWASVLISFTRSLSPTSAPCCPCANNPSTAGLNTRTNVACEFTPVTMASNVSPILLLIVTAAIRFDIARSTLRCIFFQRTVKCDRAEFHC